MTRQIKTADAKFGEQMIEVSVNFFTDSIAPGPKGTIRPRHALTKGEAHTTRNDSHGITTGEPRFFNSLGELPLAIEKALIDAGIKLHPYYGRMRKFMSED